MTRVAVVTGASRGIGAAIGARLASHGMHVALTARTLEPEEGRDGSLTAVVERIRAAGGTAVPIRADLSSPEDRRHLVSQTTSQLGPIDVLVNNAAVTFLYPFTQFPEKQWWLMFEVQVRAPYELTQLVVPGMVERGEGWILNISSRAAAHPEGPPFPAVHVAPWTTYGMVKAALDRFSTSLAAELSPHRVAVNALAPWDNVATPGATAHHLVKGFDLESPDLMAEAALLLCTGDPAVLTGRVAYSQQLLAELQPQDEGHRADDRQ